MSVVYAIHEPSRWDTKARAMVPMSLGPAEEYGKVVIIFPGRDRPPSIEQCGEELKSAMAAYKPGDKLLMAGDMDLVIFAAALVAKRLGRLSLLKWHRRDGRYYEIEAPEGLLC